MGLIQRLLTDIITERPARRATWQRQIADLEASGASIQARCAKASGSARNIDQLRHVIGIERWGQSRLRVALGAPLTTDEYDGYRPEDIGDWSSLTTAFTATRAATVALVPELQAAGLDRSRLIPHNQMGALSVGGWLQYLRLHAGLESKLIR